MRAGLSSTCSRPKKYSKTKTTSIAYTCASASAAKISIDTYKVPDGLPHDGFGAYIAVDKNGKMIRNGHFLINNFFS